MITESNLQEMNKDELVKMLLAGDAPSGSHVHTQEVRDLALWSLILKV